MSIISANSSNLEAALHYASLNYKVFPVHGFLNGACTCCKSPCPQGSKPGKHPACTHGYKDASVNQEQVTLWFSGQPWLNVGIALDEQTLGVDVDPGKGGLISLEAWEREHGPLPQTPKVLTGSKGFHMYYKLPPSMKVLSKAGWAPGIDTRSLGGYLIAPPSLHECGGRYEWLVPLDEPLAMAPDWLLKIVAEKPMSARNIPSRITGFGLVHDDGPCDFSSHPGAPEGKRHQELIRLAGIHLARGDSLKSIEAMATSWGARCTPPCEPEGILQKVRGLAERDASRRGPSLELKGKGFGFGVVAHEEGEGPEDGAQEAQAPLHAACCRSATAERPHEPAVELEPEVVFSIDTASVQSQEAWPELGPEAYHGILGAIVQAIAPETEADPVAVLLSLATAVGSCVGKGPHFALASGVHHANLFSSIVGDTASGKGQSWGVVHKLMEKADPEWESGAIAYGLSSGEGLVDRVKDEDEPQEAGFFGSIPEAKRLLCVETEFAKPITAMRREGNTLSPLLRSAWDGLTLEVLTRGKSKLRASNAHVSVLAHITPEELTKLLGQSVEVANGFSNRFLWGLARRSNVLPEGGDPAILEPFHEPLRVALAKAKNIGRVVRDEGAKARWASVYEGLTTPRPGAYGMATGRGHAQTLRLSLIFALMDGSEVVKVEHLEAALAVWQYCQHSARIIFGKAPEVTEKGREERDEPLDFKLLMMIEKNPGVKRAELVQALPSNKRALAGEALAGLQASGLAHPRMEATAGRKAECWYLGPMPEGPDDGEGDDPPAGYREDVEWMEGNSPAMNFGLVVSADGMEDMEGKLSGSNLLSIHSISSTANVPGAEDGSNLSSIPSILSTSIIPVSNAKASESQHEARLSTIPPLPLLFNQRQQVQGGGIPQTEKWKRERAEAIIPKEHFDVMFEAFFDDLACKPVSEHARKLCEMYGSPLSPAFGSRV